MKLSHAAPRMEVRFPGVNMDLFRVQGAKLTQSALAHDVLQLKVSTGPTYAELAEGAPVTFLWETLRGTGQFWGYVHRVDPQFRTGTTPSNIICVGASYPLMAAATDVWVGARASDVARDVAARFRLAADVEDHPRVYEQISQAGESYWQLLVRLAKETGWVLRVDGATLRFRSRESMTAGTRPHAAVMEYTRDPEARRQISSFVPQIGAYTPENGAQQAGAIGAVDASTGAVLGAAPAVLGLRGSAVTRTGPSTGAVVRSAIEAESASRAARENARFALRARMESVGDPLIQPEGFVTVTGLPQEMAGSWVVRKVVHELTPTSYHCITDLGTDGLGPRQLLPGESGTKLEEVNPHRPGALPRAHAPLLVDNRKQVGAGGGPAQVHWTAPVVNWRS